MWRISVEYLDIIVQAANNPTNKIFTYIIGAATGIGFFLAIIHKLERLKSYLPSLIVSVGIFGTFWGIFVGLDGFDTSQISASIPALLDGMKIAFFTSLAGMFASMILRLIYSLLDDVSQKGSANPARSLQNIEVSSVEVRNSILRLEKTINRCFRSDEEYSLVSQVKLIRQEIIDSRRETKVAFELFIDKFSKMASESLVDELKRVVDKFNSMLTDLVGQSFQDLKNSTERLNRWQADYMVTIEQNNSNLRAVLAQIEALKITYDQALEGVESLSEEFSSIDSSLKSVALSGGELSSHSASLATQNKILETSLLAIQDAGEKAAVVVPEISTKMGAIISQIQELQEKTNDFVKATTSELQAHTLELSDTSKQQIAAIEKSLQEELTKSLESFAGAMVALSNRFVSDYTPLTNQLRELVQLAQQVKNV